ncbi:MAG: bifunctional (p)ppGpp synthetase/guanosine-3',5'-bis(diphosphate) 3'-pyrophosphohydrolase [Bacteroidales bacterium]|nr:bifunctional (p)ppGpp synthetase/guanosine-3',5'-bis(diphosphate) 3'-pyrophosphohydrolase [Bacteroidales bacterium]
MSFSKFNEDDYRQIEAAWATLEQSARKRCKGEKELAVVRRAYEFANKAHKDVRRRSGEPYMLHPLAVAQIVVDDIGLGYKSISAALLHDVVEDTHFTVEDLRKLFGDKISSLVDGLTKIKTVLDNEEKHSGDVYSRSIQAENFKRILLTMGDDVRVVLIKLADRLHNCRTIEYMPEHKRDKILSETMFIFIPLAHRLGLYSIKTEMENIWLRFKEPDAYESITRRLDRTNAERLQALDEFAAPIERALKAAGFKFEIKKRVKTPYSIWRKMQLKKISFEEVYDLYAIRIIFDPDPSSTETERDQCFHIYSIATAIYRYMPERMRDWCLHPKPNGYEALHCTMMSETGKWVEVQIRSRRMDDIAEKGIAAHWAYKRSGYVSENDSEMDKWLSQVQEVLVSSDVNALELLDIIHTDLTSQTLTVFTPKGDRKSIVNGATALDFAYLIHTEVGNTAIAAKANQKLVPLSYELHMGDQVEIITAQDQHPKHEWLRFLKTRKAISVVTDYFKSERTETIEFGKGLLDDQIRLLGHKSDEQTLEKVRKHYSAASLDDLYFNIGMGNVKLGNLPEVLRESRSYLNWLRRLTGRAEKPKEDAELPGAAFVIASCCNPIPGDAVLGIKSPDGVVTVHKKSCPIGEELASTHGDWVVVPNWPSSGNNEEFFPVKLSIRGVDRVGLLNEISRYISLVMGVNIKRLELTAEEGIFEGYIEFGVINKSVLERMVKKLSAIEGIQSVWRSEL